MKFKDYLKEKTVIVCLSNHKIHLCDPFEYIWICDEAKIADEDTCEQRLDRRKDKRKSVAERFLAQINEYYLEESPLMKNASVCEECLGIFLGNLYGLGKDGLFIPNKRTDLAGEAVNI